jgi:hypothetical protein
VSGFVVKAGDAASCPGDVIQNAFDDVRKNTEFGQARAAGSSQIMNSPRRNLYRFIKSSLAFAPSRKSVLAATEYKAATIPRARLQDAAHHRHHWYGMPPAVFRARWRQDNYIALEINFIPTQVGDFALALPGQNQQFQNGPEIVLG